MRIAYGCLLGVPFFSLVGSNYATLQSTTFTRINRAGSATIDEFGPLSSILVSTNGTNLLFASVSGFIGIAYMVYDLNSSLSSFTIEQNWTLSDDSGGIIESVCAGDEGNDFLGGFSSGLVRNIPRDPGNRFSDLDDPLSYCDANIQSEISVCVSSQKEILLETLPREFGSEDLGSVVVVCGTQGWVCDGSTGESSRFSLQTKIIDLAFCPSCELPQLFLLSSTSIGSVLVSDVLQVDAVITASSTVIKIEPGTNVLTSFSLIQSPTNSSQLSMYLLSNKNLVTQYTVELLPQLDETMDAPDRSSFVFSIVILLALFGGAVVVPIYLRFRHKRHDEQYQGLVETTVTVPRKIGRRPSATILEE